MAKFLECSFKILIGPLSNPGVLGDYSQAANIKVFTHHPYFPQHLRDIYYDLNDITHFNQILEHLPAQWEPDIVIWWDLIYQGLPPGLADCPYPTAVIVGD
mgnify:FL=1